MKKRGFTLIEILVVIAIIASIIAIAIPNYLSARQRALDIKTKSEMAELKSAMRLYYNDFNSYPLSANPGKMLGCGADGKTLCPCTAGGSDFATGAACDNLYMKQIPSGLGSSILYNQYPAPPNASPDDFCLRAVLNNQSDPDIAASQTRCAKSCGANCSIGSNRYCACAD